MADLNATLVEQFLHVTVTQMEAVVEPNGVLDDRHRKSVAVGLGVGHGRPAYPDPVKATQPMAELEFSALQRQCLDRRIPSLERLSSEVQAWVTARERAGIILNWQFSIRPPAGRWGGTTRPFVLIERCTTGFRAGRSWCWYTPQPYFGTECEYVLDRL